MIDIPQLIADFEACIGWPYKSPGTNDERGIDCSGMFVRAFRLQGESIYHGSNTICHQRIAPAHRPRLHRGHEGQGGREAGQVALLGRAGRRAPVPGKGHPPPG